MSEQEAINQVKKDYIAIGNKISGSIIIIDGNEAFKDVVFCNDTEEPIKFEYIYSVKNEKILNYFFSLR